MSRYLFLFTISPVQSFIQQARKTQDLYAGSQMLSTLMNGVIQKLQNEYQADIIFPAPKMASNPNRVLAMLVEGGDPKTIGEELEKAITAQFRTFAADARSRTFEFKQPENFEEKVTRQLESFWNVSWVALPYHADYHTAYDEIERTLGGVKNIRQFQQLVEQGRKCALCGERNVLFFHSDNTERRHLESAAHVRTPQFQVGEGLCAVCTTKRFFTKETFPSTARLALMDSLAQLYADAEGAHLLTNYREHVIGKDLFDEQLYFEENLTETYFKKNGLETLAKEDDLQKILKRQREVNDYAKQRGVYFSPYYAVLVFDGDSMGTWLSGKHLKDPGEDLQKFHQRLSELLGEFAVSASAVLSDPLENKASIDYPGNFGKTVYAGGDDFLGFVTLKHLFPALQHLRKQFDEKVNKPLRKEFSFHDAAGDFTFSAGVAIAHYKTPLSMVLQKARNMEKMAKSVKSQELGDKDSVGFALLKHSGNVGETVFKWTFEEDTVVLAQALTAALQNWISNKFLYVLREELLGLFDEDTGIEPGILETELQRLMNRRKRDPDISNAQVRELSARLLAFWNQLDVLSLEETSRFNHLINFLNFLELCNFVAREV